MANSKWTRDETILTLDFYFKNYPNIPNESSLEVKEVSDNLRKLQVKLGGEVNKNFRSHHSVHFKLLKFQNLNPDHPGNALSKFSKLDEEVFQEFEHDREKLREISALIIRNLNSNEPLGVIDIDDDEESIAKEGKLLTRIHRYRERNQKIIKQKKDDALTNTGSLKCEGCGFDFKETYGEHGDGFVECHHLIPVSEIKDGHKTTLKDLSLVCSNCHRMIHRHKPWLTMDKLQKLVTINIS